MSNKQKSQSTRTNSTCDANDNKCALCNSPSNTRCSSCRLVFYCCKDHQRSDWPKHRSICNSKKNNSSKAYEVCESPELGRHLVASRDLAPEELVLTEAPLVWGPSFHAAGEKRVCVGCGGCPEALLVRCPGCAWPACRLACDGLLDEQRHGYECKILAAARLLPRCEYLLVLRVLLLRRRHPKRWRALTKLQSHEESRGCGTEAYDEMKAIAQYLGPLLALDSSMADALPQVCGLIDVNALETNPPEGSAGIYENACLLEHCCIANTRHTFAMDEQGRPRISVITVAPIKKGEHLSTTYTHVLWATRARREHLLLTKYFTCKCERCVDPNELGSNLGTLKCPCEKGLVTPNDPINPDSDWSCNVCPGILSSNEVNQLVDRLGEEVEAAMSVANKDILSDLLFRLTVLLHPCHQHCITVSHTLLQMLEPKDKKKEELCQRMLYIFAIVDPHGVRLPLYQAIVLRELATCPNQNNISLLSKAVEILRYEPPNSAGGQLLKLILSEV